MRVYVVRKWPLRGRSFVCWNITRVSLWLLCNVNFVQSIRPTIDTWTRWPKGTDHCSSEEYRCTHVDACVARTWISYRCVPCHPWCTHRTSLVVKKRKTFSLFLWLWTIPFRQVFWFSFYGVWRLLFYSHDWAALLPLPTSELFTVCLDRTLW